MLQFKISCDKNSETRWDKNIILIHPEDLPNFENKYDDDVIIVDSLATAGSYEALIESYRKACEFLDTIRAPYYYPVGLLNRSSCYVLPHILKYAYYLYKTKNISYARQIFKTYRLDIEFLCFYFPIEKERLLLENIFCE